MGRTPYLGFLGQTSTFDEEIARDALKRVDALGLADRRVGELSGGEGQRVLLARALCQSTPILLLDEPTGNVDSKTASEVLSLIKKLNTENNVSIIMVTHDQHLAREAKRTVQMFDGQIISEAVNQE